MAVCLSLFLCLYLLPGTVFFFFSSLFRLLESYVTPFLCLFESDSPFSALGFFSLPAQSLLSSPSVFLPRCLCHSLFLSLSYSFSASSFSTSLYYLIFTLSLFLVLSLLSFSVSLSLFLTHSIFICLSVSVFVCHISASLKT